MCHVSIKIIFLFLFIKKHLYKAHRYAVKYGCVAQRVVTQKSTMTTHVYEKDLQETK